MCLQPDTWIKSASLELVCVLVLEQRCCLNGAYRAKKGVFLSPATQPQ